jgi:hypothetical protein
MAKALLPPEEFAGENTKLHLCMLQESGESEINVDMFSTFSG